MNGRISLLCLALAFALLFALPAVATADDFNGKVSTAAEGKLVVLVGEDQHTFMVNDKTKITLDGKEAKFEDIKAGQTVKVTATKEGEKWTASAIDARSAL
jgi:nitrous oxidase accessory protein NosD